MDDLILLIDYTTIDDVNKKTVLVIPDGQRHNPFKGLLGEENNEEYMYSKYNTVAALYRKLLPNYIIETLKCINAITNNISDVVTVANGHISKSALPNVVKHEMSIAGDSNVRIKDDIFLVSTKEIPDDDLLIEGVYIFTAITGYVRVINNPEDAVYSHIPKEIPIPDIIKIAKKTAIHKHLQSRTLPIGTRVTNPTTVDLEYLSSVFTITTNLCAGDVITGPLIDIIIKRCVVNNGSLEIRINYEK